jgi:hypothetical protein
MGSVLDEGGRQALCRRIAALTDASTPRWGRMDVAAMLGHLCQSLRLALGERPVRSSGKRAFQVFPLKHLLIYVLPFPKGAPTAPELLVTEPGGAAAAKASLPKLLERLGTGPTKGAGPAHPLLGPLSRQEWGVLMHKHIDHHLRQFGV